MSLKEQILEVRNSGRVNMLDASGVQYVANECGFYDLVCFVEERRRDYARYIMTGDESILAAF